MRAAVLFVAASAAMASAGSLHARHAGLHQRAAELPKNDTLTTVTVYTTTLETITACPVTVTDCPAHKTSVTVKTIAAYTTVCPKSEAYKYPQPPKCPKGTSCYKGDEEEPATVTVSIYPSSYPSNSSYSTAPAFPAIPSCTCGTATAYVTTITGDACLYDSDTTSTIYSTSTQYQSVTVTPVAPYPIVPAKPSNPAPYVTTCQTTGVYTFPAETIVIKETTTVCAATSTPLPPGTHTVGGVTTIIKTATTVVCPVATYAARNGTTTSVLTSTTYVCPTPGTYTIHPTTTTVTESTTCYYPVPTVYVPATYVKPAQTVTITKAYEVYYCPYAVAEAPAPTYNAPVPPKSTPAAFYASPSTTPAAKAPKGDNPKIGVAKGPWAIVYSPYQGNKQCKDASTVEKEIAIIAGKGFKSVRLYATDCSGLINVGAACEKYGLTIIVGIYLDKSTGISGFHDQVAAIKAWGKYSIIELIVVGNEAIFNGVCSAQEIVSYIEYCKSQFSGYSGSYTTAETLNILQANSGTLCGAVDVVGANVHPYFNAQTSAADAGKFTKGQIDIASSLCGGKKAYNLETGWPSQGSPNGAAIPSKENQKIALDGIVAECGEESVFLSYENDMWKPAGDLGIEQYFGCSDYFS